MDRFTHNSMYLQFATYWVNSCQHFLDLVNEYENVPEEWKEEEIYPEIMERLIKAQEGLEKIRLE